MTQGRNTANALSPASTLNSALQNVYDGTFYASPSWGYFKGRYGVKLNGSSQYIANTYASGTDSSNFTFCVWVNKTGNGVSVHDFVFDGGQDGNNNLFLAFLSHSNTQITIGKTGVSADLVASASFFSNWVHVAVVQSWTTKSLYINGALAASTNFSFDYARTYPSAIGAELVPSAANAFNGWLSDFRSYRQNLDAPRIRRIYQGLE